jgi:hypothetical protein
MMSDKFTDNFVSALADDIAEVIPTTAPKKPKSNFLIKIFGAAFIILLIYMLFITFKPGHKGKNNEVSVAGLYFGTIPPRTDNKAIISLGDKSDLKSGVINLDKKEDTTKPEPSPEPEPKPDPEPDKPIEEPKPATQISDKLKIGMSYFDTVAILGPPKKKLNVVSENKESGFTIYLWEAGQKLMIMFYKGKLHSYSLR